MRDTPHDILKKLKARYADERDLRVLARDILAAHALVESVHFSDDGVRFWLKGNIGGKIGADGATFIGQGSEEESRWDAYPPSPPRAPARALTVAKPAAGPSWDAPQGGDLDDEIPF
jgi:hypothetical protein